ncbi:MAG: DUF4367 domain-containing protein [Clostridia bacterium]|nr:DUF4367 domain-containing protein [Clostridia bacterium]
MLNHNEKLEIVKRLQNDPEADMTQADMEKLLDQELAKPEEEIDAALVDALLALLDEHEPTEEEIRASWAQLEAASGKKALPPIVQKVGRIAAIVVLAVAAVFATYGTAEAFHWEQVLRLLRPVAETFSLYSNNQATEPPVTRDGTAYSDAPTGISQQVYATLADCPQTFDSYPVQPSWMPERFAFLQGSLYADDNTAVMTVAYLADEGACILTTTFFRNEKTVSNFEYERTLSNPDVRILAGQEVAYYHNTDQGMLSASWVIEKAHYFITGPVTEDELTRIVESTIMQDTN